MKLKLNFASYVKTALEYCLSSTFVIYFVCIWVCEGEIERGCIWVSALVKRSGTTYNSILPDLAETGDCTLVVGLKNRHL